jgi:hypothetical protein
MIAEPSNTPQPATVNVDSRLRFDRNELAGAFGDIGTDLPLIIGMILAAGLDSASVLVMFGLMQVFTALVYRIPMAVQPLKAVAVIVITQRIAPELLYGGGLAIGVAMLLLTLSGGIDWLARIVPRAVVRGLQLGLGLQLALLALRDYVQRDGARGYVLAAAAFVIVIALLGNRRFPPALFVIGLGNRLCDRLQSRSSADSRGQRLSLPTVHPLSLSDIVSGFVLLAIPQIPLSLGNSVLATRQIAEDLFPERRITVRKLGITYAAMNLVNPGLAEFRRATDREVSPAITPSVRAPADRSSSTARSTLQSGCFLPAYSSRQYRYFLSRCSEFFYCSRDLR